ncbi:uncharacterized protein LOC126905666 [Daktulosphaira vitifoliae]|uniref:uncharacterized protein LOC126905666 n=1 Tax=Daktulosphaira vitifoliae TaxID=58002 RepID=UPI0021AABACE|nr:uncharacterized protein LOC126905666 [Daktulosphaira vitifoliae]
MENNYILSGSHPWKNSCMEENFMELITQVTWEDNVNSLVNSHLDSQPSENSNMEDSLMELIAQDTLDHTVKSIDDDDDNEEIKRNVACWNNDFYDEKRALEVDLITLKAMEKYEKKLKNKNKKNCLQ